MKVAVGGIHTECSTYSPLHQTADDFTLVRGQALLDQCGLNCAEFSGIAFAPLFHARSIPGGPVTLECYSDFRRQFLSNLKDALPLDGVLLIMHGAMFVPGLDDPEGDWISGVREVVGSDVPIAVSYDLHGNVTQQIVDQIDIFCAYRTAPHIDVKATHQRAARQLVTQLRDGERRFVALAHIPVLLPGEKTSTEDDPAKSLYNTLASFDQRAGVCDCNLMVGYVWADTARATAAAVVTGTDKQASLQAAAEIAAAYWAARENFCFGVPTKPLEACLDDAEASESHPFILADSGDNPTGGGVGDRSDILTSWLARGLKNAVFAGIDDPRAVETAWSFDESSWMDLTIGAAYGSSCPVVTERVRLKKKLGDAADRTREILVEIGENLLILTERRRPFHALEDFRRFGIDPLTAQFLIVKSGYLSPELAVIANPARMALTDGAVNQDISSLTNHHRAYPSFPFQKEFDWQSRATLSARA